MYLSSLIDKNIRIPMCVSYLGGTVLQHVLLSKIIEKCLIMNSTNSKAIPTPQLLILFRVKGQLTNEFVYFLYQYVVVRDVTELEMQQSNLLWNGLNMTRFITNPKLKY